MNRLLKFLIVLLIILLVLGGCSDGANNSVEIAALQKELAALKEEVERLKARDDVLLEGSVFSFGLNGTDIELTILYRFWPLCVCRKSSAISK